jgi:hypothetical protein
MRAVVDAADQARATVTRYCERDPSAHLEMTIRRSCSLASTKVTGDDEPNNDRPLLDTLKLA